MIDFEEMKKSSLNLVCEYIRMIAIIIRGVLRTVSHMILSTSTGKQETINAVMTVRASRA